MFDYAFLLPISKTMLYNTRVNISMVCEKIPLVITEKTKPQMQIKKCSQFNVSTNVLFLSTVKNAKCAFMLLKYVYTQNDVLWWNKNINIVLL